MISLNAGDLDREVTIEQLTSSVGATKFPVETWSTLHAGVWMSKEQASGSERFGFGQLQASLVTVWTMRYIADMDPDLLDVPKARRLVYGGRTYDITAAVHIGRKDRIELTTLAGGR